MQVSMETTHIELTQANACDMIYPLLVDIVTLEVRDLMTDALIHHYTPYEEAFAELHVMRVQELLQLVVQGETPLPLPPNLTVMMDPTLDLSTIPFLFLDVWYRVFFEVPVEDSVFQAYLVMNNLVNHQLIPATQDGTT